MRKQRWFLGGRGLLPLALAVLTGCAQEPVPDPPAKGKDIEALPNDEGTITFWLAAPGGKESFEKTNSPPQDAREGRPGPGGVPWRMHVVEGPTVGPPAELRDRGGVIWYATRLRSQSGGERTLNVTSPAAVKVFLDEQAVLAKAEADAFQGVSASARLTIPKGESQLAVAVRGKWSADCRITLRDGGNRKPSASDCILLPLSAESKEDGGTLLARAFSAAPASTYLTEGRPCEVRAALLGSYPAGLGEVTARFLDADGAVLPGDTPPLALEHLTRRQWIAKYTPRFAPPRRAPGVVELRCEFHAGGRLLSSKPVRLYSLPGLAGEALGLNQEVKQAREKDPCSCPLAALAVEKLTMIFDALPQDGRLPAEGGWGELLAELLENGRTALAAEAAGRDPLAGKAGYLERAYISRIDNSAQPYFAMVPGACVAEFAGGRKFPLVIFLHGYVPDYNKVQWWTAFPEFNAQFERREALLAIPFGRSNTDFLGPGEVDVLEVLAEMKRLYPVDEDRVYLYGYSMGGMGAYSLAGHYPEPWAAAVALAGRADSALLMRAGAIEKLHPFKQFLVRTDQPIDLCENFVSLPLRVWHGKQDQFIPPKEAERMVARVKALGGDAELTLVDGDHYSLFDVMASDAPLDWLLKQKREPKQARRRLKNYSLRFGRLWEMSVEHVSGEPAPFDLEWRGGRLKSFSGPVTRFSHFIRGGAGLELAVPEGFSSGVRRVRGAAPPAETSETVVQQDAFMGDRKPEAGWEPTWKHPRRCGPVKEATYGPFLIVYGTAGGEEAAKRLKRQAEDFAVNWWLRFAKGLPGVKADLEVTGEEQKTRNLFLFGEEQENLLHAAAARTGRLPIRVKEGAVTIGERTILLREGVAQRGVMYIHPSPLEGAGESCSVVIVAGHPYGGKLPVNHKLDLVPDFLVYDQAADDDGTDTNRPVAAGFFDGKWRLDPKLTWWFIRP